VVKAKLLKAAQLVNQVKGILLQSGEVVESVNKAEVDLMAALGDIDREVR
jgi:hypothetical protein